MAKENRQDYINRDVKETLLDHAKHLEIANHEMADVRTRLSVVEYKVILAVKQNWAILTLLTSIILGTIIKFLME